MTDDPRATGGGSGIGETSGEAQSTRQVPAASGGGGYSRDENGLCTCGGSASGIPAPGHKFGTGTSCGAPATTYSTLQWAELERHVILSAVYRGVPVVLGKLERIVTDFLAESCDTGEAWARGWNSGVWIDPGQITLSEAWQHLSDEQREYLRQNMPQLFSAIYFALLGSVEPAAEKCGAASPGNGSPCTMRGKHDVHISGSPTGRGAGSEVWRS